MARTDLIVRTPQIGGERRIVEAQTAQGARYLQQFGRFMEQVCFGEGGTALATHYAVDWRRVEKMGSHIEAQGLTWGRA